MARRILLADDSVTAQNMGRRILTDAGYEVVTVNNGSAALKKIAENKPDLIVLDVYMPGYGGLEVCQRVKESRETRQIPVLLTVGKLEPFKQDEAKRVGADAFIVKPFEATELLTVLTRLEDKIVAQPQPQKGGRFAKALAAVEQSDAADRFGDKETGWKNRLIIPRPDAKPRAEEQAPEAVVSAPAAGSEPRGAENVSASLVSGQIENVKHAEPSRDFASAIPGLPADITPAEIAAITAAAAAFGGPPEAERTNTEIATSEVVADPAALPEPVSAEAPSSENATPEISNAQPVEVQAADAAVAAMPKVSVTGTPEIAQEVATASVLAQPAPVEAVSETVSGMESPKVEELSASAPVFEPASAPPPAEAKTSEIERPAGDDEVMAAIASLAPAHGHAAEPLHPLANNSNGASQQDAATLHSAGAGGPRWIAEAVAVGADELKQALEQEMEQAHAARAVAQPSSFAPASKSEIPSEIPSTIEAVSIAEISVAAESASPAMVAQPIAAESMAAESAITESQITESQITESPVVESPVVESPVVESSIVEALNQQAATGESQAVESSLSESTIEASAVAAAAVEPSIVAAPSFGSAPGESSSVQEADLAPITDVTAKEEAAFAAAASAGAAPEYSSPAEAESLSTAAPELPRSKPAVSEAEPKREAELAAAWKNWKQIRESMLEPAPTSSTAPAAAGEENPKAQEEEVSSGPSLPAETVAEAEAATAEAPEESTAIASIVDTMLAELRPKLVAEIAKKMSSEKDKKERDKDRDRDRDRKKKK